MVDCIFCRIIKGEVPCTKLYEDEDTIAFLDISPVHPGHTLVVPKEHYENLTDAPDEVLEAVIRTTKKLTRAVTKSLNSGANIGVNNGREAGQVVFHLHVHIIPRYKNDGLKMFPQKRYSEGGAENVAEKIRRALRKDDEDRR